VTEEFNEFELLSWEWKCRDNMSNGRSGTSDE